MKVVASVSLLLIGCEGLLPSRASAQEEQDFKSLIEANAIVEQKVMMPMRDGSRLATDIYRPKTDKPVPIILWKTPYNRNAWQNGQVVERTYQSAWEAVRRGYAFVIQNERGRLYSEGEWDFLGIPTTDGYDAFEWMASQPWSNGKIGTLGCSSPAEWQMSVASLDHPAHSTLVAQGFGAGVGRIGDWYEQGNWFRGGAEQLFWQPWLYGYQANIRPMFPPDLTQEELRRVSRFWDLEQEMPAVDWAETIKDLPLIDMLKNVQANDGIYEKQIVRTPNDPAWYEGGLFHDDMPFEKPSLWFMSWYDVSVGPNLAFFNYVRETATDKVAKENQYAFIAPTTHCAYQRVSENYVVGERNVGDARWDYDALIFGWFDMWLKGEGSELIDTLPPVRYFTMGSNEWQSTTAWPPPNADMVTYYLESGGAANTLHGDGRLTREVPASGVTDSFTYDPLDPVPSKGGGICCMGNAVEGGSFDQRDIEQREDVLVYTSDPLEEGVEVTGWIETELYVSTDVRDTDFTIKILDVYPDGRAYNLDETIQRARYRDGYEEAVFMEAGEVYQVKLGPMATSNFFEAGHSIRVEVSSSNFPRFNRNLNTGGRIWDETEGVVAHNSVHHSPQYPSQVRIPFVRRPM